jgi:hypothetical protein
MEENRLRMSAKCVLRKIFGPKSDEITEKWRKLHKEELYDLYFSPHFLGYQIKRNEIDVACCTYGTEGKCIQGFGGET